MTTTIRTNASGFVEFDSRNFRRNGDRTHWVRQNADGSLTFNRGKGVLSEEYAADLEALLAQYGKSFDDLCAAPDGRLTVTAADMVQEEEPVEEVHAEEEAEAPAENERFSYDTASLPAEVLIFSDDQWGDEEYAMKSWEDFHEVFLNTWNYTEEEYNALCEMESSESGIYPAYHIASNVYLMSGTNRYYELAGFGEGDNICDVVELQKCMTMTGAEIKDVDPEEYEGDRFFVFAYGKNYRTGTHYEQEEVTTMEELKFQLTAGQGMEEELFDAPADQAALIDETSHDFYAMEDIYNA